jgi:hypothetical protein
LRRSALGYPQASNGGQRSEGALEFSTVDLKRSIKRHSEDWHKAVLILAFVGVAMSIFAWLCLRDPAISFLSRDNESSR